MQAVILAAGMGKRLGELTKNNTKCIRRQDCRSNVRWKNKTGKSCKCNSKRRRSANTIKKPMIYIDKEPSHEV